VKTAHRTTRTPATWTKAPSRVGRTGIGAAGRPPGEERAVQLRDIRMSACPEIDQLRGRSDAGLLACLPRLMVPYRSDATALAMELRSSLAAETGKDAPHRRAS